MPCCSKCGSDKVEWFEACGRGTVYSLVTAHAAVSPGYVGPWPYSVATIALEEGPRVFARLDSLEGLQIGSAVEASFEDHRKWTELIFRGTGTVAPIVETSAPPASRSCNPRKAKPGAAIAGVGYTEFTRRSERSVLSLAVEAAGAALADAGLKPSEVDGMASFMLGGDSVPCIAVASALGVDSLRLAVDLNLGGQAPCYLVWQAARAIERGDAEVVVVYRALNGRSGAKVGSMQFPGAGGQYRYPIGYGAYMMYVAMWGRRFLAETAQDELDLAAVAIAQRHYAEMNERAVRRERLDEAAYLAEPLVVDPYRRSDCTVEVDGACAVVITSLERTRDLRHPPAVIASGAYRAGKGAGLDIGDHLMWQDYSRNYTSWLRDELFGQAGLCPADVQIAEIYDCFTSTVMMGLEGLGLCGRGESGAMIREGPPFAINTSGGLLAEGYLHGMNTVSEAALQVQGRGGNRQAARHEVAAVTSGALVDGSALILTVDR